MYNNAATIQFPRSRKRLRNPPEQRRETGKDKRYKAFRRCARKLIKMLNSLCRLDVKL